MHKNFSEWYRLVSIEPDGERLKTRWAGVSAWADELIENDEYILETLRIFHNLPCKEGRDAFVDILREEDAAFAQQNDFELRLLAGASLVDCVQSIKEDNEGVHTTALLGAAMEILSLHEIEPELQDISREIIRNLQRIAIGQRERRPSDLEAVEAKIESVKSEIANIGTLDSWENFNAIVTPIFNSLIGALHEMKSELLKSNFNLQRADEEVNILWWMEGGTSRDTDKSWATLKEGAAIIAGTELAQLTDVTLGPLNSRALLKRVLSEFEDKQESLATYINSLPEDWVQNLTDEIDEGALDLTPITSAMVRRIASDTQSWQQFFDSSSWLKSSSELNAVRVARQAYFEAILYQALNDAESEE